LQTIYLDACCLNRPFDDQRQPRIRLEAEAVLLVLRRITAGGIQWLGSSVLEFEIGRMSDQERLHRIRAMLADVSHRVQVEATDIARGEELEALGFGDFDALHLACAERGGAEIFLTTDAPLLRRAKRYEGMLRVRVLNPVSWISEEKES
jgi:predicted nucleic acid-binding protein